MSHKISLRFLKFSCQDFHLSVLKISAFGVLTSYQNCLLNDKLWDLVLRSIKRIRNQSACFRIWYLFWSTSSLITWSEASSSTAGLWQNLHFFSDWSTISTVLRRYHVSLLLTFALETIVGILLRYSGLFIHCLLFAKSWRRINATNPIILILHSQRTVTRKMK